MNHDDTTATTPESHRDAIAEQADAQGDTGLPSRALIG